MAPISVPTSLWDWAALGLLVVFAVAVERFIQNLFFHPLAKYPGPKLWAASRLPFVVSLLRGNLVRDMDKFHKRYGGVVRLAPDELSFATEEAWKDIHGHRPGHKAAVKSEHWYITASGLPPSIVTTRDVHVRARQRRLLSRPFSEQGLQDQAPVIERFVGLCFKQIGLVVGETDADVNLNDWINFFTVDIIGDLAIGESFHCLENNTYHPWVQTLHSFFKGMVLASAIRYIRGAETILYHTLAKPTLRREKEFSKFTSDRISKRVELSTSRRDFMTPFLDELSKVPKVEKMSLDEIQSTFAVLIAAGSDTTATSTSGTIYQLAHHIDVQEALRGTLREKFKETEAITIESIGDIPFLDACISEGMRLGYPVAGGLPRESPLDSGITIDGHYVPPNTTFSVRPHTIFRSEKYFAQPLSFKPERWSANPPPEFANDHLSAFRPFSMGPTGCIGQDLAWAEMRLFTARLVHAFEFKMADGKDFNWDDQGMMWTIEKSPLWVNMRKISS